MAKSNKLAGSALIIVIFTLASKFLGFFRETLIASNFGSGIETDAYFVAMTATGLITGFLSNAVSTTLIPILSEIESKEGKVGKIKHVNNMINIIFIITIIVVILGELTAPFIINLLAKGFEGNQFLLAVKLTRIGLPMILFGGSIGIFTGYLQSEQRFMSSAAVGLPFNLIYIFFLLFLSNKFGIKGLMVSAVIASGSQFLIQIPEARKIGYRYKFEFDLKDKYIKKIILLSIPVLIGVAVNDFNAIIDRRLASTLVYGSISSLNYANRLKSLILGVFISAITTIIFPLLSKEINNNNIKGMKDVMNRGIDLILLITIPATVGLIVLSTPIVEIAFKRGEFGSKATLMTSKALIFYSIGLLAMALRLLIVRVYYSLQDTKTPMINSAISVIFNITLNLILIRFMAHNGLALATSISAIISIILLLYSLRKKIGSLGTKKTIITFSKTGLASLIMGFISYVTYHNLYRMLEVSKINNLISLLISVGLGVSIYVILCYVFNVKEIKNITNKLKNK